jgi:hypothetical protein
VRSDSAIPSSDLFINVGTGEGGVEFTPPTPPRQAPFAAAPGRRDQRFNMRPLDIGHAAWISQFPRSYRPRVSIAHIRELPSNQEVSSELQTTQMNQFAPDGHSEN